VQLKNSRKLIGKDIMKSSLEPVGEEEDLPKNKQEKNSLAEEESNENINSDNNNVYSNKKYNNNINNYGYVNSNNHRNTRDKQLTRKKQSVNLIGLHS
jgi:hypothetical protein